MALVADGQTVTDQGIEMRVVSAITDGMATEIYVEARDLQGDRLVDDAIDVSGLIRQPQAEADAKERAEKGKVSSWVTRQECVGYDPETKTALLRFGRYNHEQTESPDGQEELNLQIFSLLPRNYQAQADLPQGLLTEQTRKSRKLETGETVLEPNQSWKIRGFPFPPWGLTSRENSISSWSFPPRPIKITPLYWPLFTAKRRKRWI